MAKKIKEFLKHHRPVAVLMGIVLVLTAIPALDTYVVVGNMWRGILPAFTDEALYDARVQTIVHGHTGGNPYFIEYSDGPPLVIFGGAWVNAIPQLTGLSFNTAIAANFILWSLLFAASVYWLFYELRVPSWIAVFSTVLLYLQSYAHVWRPVNLQPVYPFYFLFYIAIARLIREQSQRNIMLLGFATGAMFYLQSYIWQTFVVTLGVLFVYALVKKNWSLLKATFFSSLIGGIIGLPVPLYMLWLSRSSPYFWESMGRLGLVNTHLPMAEIIYSGGWVGVVLALLAILYWRIRTLRADREFISLSVCISVSGLGLWIMQGSNLITGTLLETGEHVKLFILPWLLFSTMSIGVFVWKRRTLIPGILQSFLVTVFTILSVANLYFSYQYFSPFLPSHVDRGAWQTQQLYAKPFAWLEQQEKSPVVVWSEPRDYLATALPVFTKHFALYAYWGVLELVPEGEVRERYLISQYFNNPTVANLKSEREMALYLGRNDFPHAAKTIEREIKLCRALFSWDKSRDCGTVPTPQSLLGEKFFTDLEAKFQNDIKPNIKAYLKKYHVSYVLKDKMLNLKYQPEKLGAVLVYADERYEIWKL